MPHRLVYRQGYTHSLTARPSGTTSPWRPFWDVCVPITLYPGVLSFPGQSTLLRATRRQHPRCLLSSAVWGTNPPCSPVRRRRWGVPSAIAFVLQCKRNWRVKRANQVRSAARMKQLADQRRILAPTYRVGQRMWLSTKDIPIQGGTCKLAPWFVGPFTIERIISPTSVHLRLEYSPPSMCQGLSLKLFIPCVPPRFPPTSSHHWREGNLHGQPTHGLSSSGPWTSVPGGLGGLQPRRKIVDSCTFYYW